MVLVPELACTLFVGGSHAADSNNDSSSMNMRDEGKPQDFT